MKTSLQSKRVLRNPRRTCYFCSFSGNQSFTLPSEFLIHGGKMKITTIISSFLLAGSLLPTTQAAAASAMKEGPVTLKSAGPITFGPQGVLLVADTKSAAIVAIDTADTKAGNDRGNG